MALNASCNRLITVARSQRLSGGVTQLNLVLDSLVRWEL
jgi:hypothetical protein